MVTNSNFRLKSISGHSKTFARVSSYVMSLKTASENGAWAVLEVIEISKKGIRRSNDVQD
jgi:hypothetical protein